MKLSELKGERAIEVIADLIAPIANIALDQNNLQLFRSSRKDGETEREASIRDFSEKIPKLLKTHKKDVLAIICAVNDAKPEELSMIDIMQGAVELTKDEDFMSLFLSSVNQTDNILPTESSVIAEHTEPES